MEVTGLQVSAVAAKYSYLFCQPCEANNGALPFRAVKSQLERPPAITIGSDSAEQNQSPQRGDAD